MSDPQTGRWWLVWSWSALVVLVGLAAIVERKRNRRAERLIAHGD